MRNRTYSTPRRPHRTAALAAAMLAAVGLLSQPAAALDILFIGNSFTFGYGTPVRFFHAESVTDLNGEAQGGMPALFKSFTDELGLSYTVYLETHPGVGLDWHLEHEGDVLRGHRWDAVVMHGFSTLDAHHPGDPALLVRNTAQMASLLRQNNAAVALWLMETWPRADQIYPKGTPWHGKSLDVMTRDLKNGYARAAAGVFAMKPVVPVGNAWLRAVKSGVADPNPYDGLTAGQIDLWGYDHYHASIFGYYLEALVVLGSVTGADPRALGGGECAAAELGITPQQASALERVATAELTAEGLLPPGKAAPPRNPKCGKGTAP